MCVLHLFLTFWYWSDKFLLTWALRNILFSPQKSHKSEINPLQPQSWYCYDWSSEFIDLCHRKKLLTCHSCHRPESFVARTSNFCHWCTRHLWPDLPIFATDALIHFFQHLFQWYLISSPTLFIHQSTQSMNSWHTSIYSKCDLIFDHDPAHCYIQYTEVPITLVFQVIVWTH